MKTPKQHFYSRVWLRKIDNQSFITIPKRQHTDFPPGSEVSITIADSPEISMTSKVRISDKNLTIKIMRRDQEELADKFTGKYVRVEAKL